MKKSRISNAFVFGTLGVLLALNAYAEGDACPTADCAAEAKSIAEPIALTTTAPVTVAPVGELAGVSVLIDKTIKIMTADVDEMAASVFKANKKMIKPDDEAEAKVSIRKSVIQQLEMQAILERECDKESITVTDKERDDFFAKVTGGESTYEKIAEESNMPVEKFLEFFTKNIRIEKLLNSKIADLPKPTDEEVKARFDQVVEANPESVKTPESVEASHVLIKVDEATKDEEAKKKIDAIRIKLVEGADFAEVAKENSDCPSKDKGGSLGEFGRGQMVPEFEEAAFTQKIGEVGPVVKTQFGYHIIKVDSKKEAGEVKFDDVKEQIAESIVKESANKIRSEFIAGLRDAAQIENLEAPVVSDPMQAQPKELPEWAR